LIFWTIPPTTLMTISTTQRRASLSSGRSARMEHVVDTMKSVT